MKESILNHVRFLVLAIEDEDLKKEREVLMLAGHLNLAACHLKLNSYSSARDECDKALEFDSTNVKALFRRGQVRSQKKKSKR